MSNWSTTHIVRPSGLDIMPNTLIPSAFSTSTIWKTATSTSTIMHDVTKTASRIATTTLTKTIMGTTTTTLATTITKTKTIINGTAIPTSIYEALVEAVQAPGQIPLPAINWAIGAVLMGSGLGLAGYLGTIYGRRTAQNNPSSRAEALARVSTVLAEDETLRQGLEAARPPIRHIIPASSSSSSSNPRKRKASHEQDEIDPQSPTPQPPSRNTPPRRGIQHLWTTFTTTLFRRQPADPAPEAPPTSKRRRISRPISRSPLPADTPSTYATAVYSGFPDMDTPERKLIREAVGIQRSPAPVRILLPRAETQRLDFETMPVLQPQPHPDTPVQSVEGPGEEMAGERKRRSKRARGSKSVGVEEEEERRRSPRLAVPKGQTGTRWSAGL